MLRGKRRVRTLSYIVFILLVLVIVTSYLLRSPGTANFHLYRARYEAIVVKIKTLGIAPGEYRYVWTNARMEPDSLSLRRLNNDNMVGMIGVMHTMSGPYQIAIITRDEGHFGTFGYSYSDVPSGVASTGELPSIERQVSPHWWIAYNDKW